MGYITFGVLENVQRLHLNLKAVNTKANTINMEIFFPFAGYKKKNLASLQVLFLIHVTDYQAPKLSFNGPSHLFRPGNMGHIRQIGGLD